MLLLRFSPTQPKARQRAFLMHLAALQMILKRTFQKRKGLLLIDKMNRTDIWVKKPSDLINWTIVKISDPLPKEYSISEGLNLKIMKGKSDQEYYRVRMVE